VDPIADDELLLARMRALFPSGLMPGVRSEILRVDHQAGTVNLRFEASEVTANQLGAVQGGIVAAMLDGCIGIAGAVRSGGVLAMPLAELNTSFVRPVRPGTVFGEGAVVRLGRKVGFIEATLTDPEGRVVARASGTAIPTPFPDEHTP
jgi:uncharacterized protein (TIGR00369 family)